MNKLNDNKIVKKEEKKGCISCKFAQIGYEHALFCCHPDLDRYVPSDRYDIPCEYRIPVDFYKIIKHDGIVTHVKVSNDGKPSPVR